VNGKIPGEQQNFVNRYFWRSQNQQRIDYIEERDGVLNAFEFKWNPAARADLPKTLSMNGTN